MNIREENIINSELNTITSFLIVLSAKREESLYARIQDLLSWIESNSPVQLLDLSYNLLEKSHFKVRYATIVNSESELKDKLSCYLKENKANTYNNIAFSPDEDMTENQKNLFLLAESFVKGENIDKKLLFGNEKCKRISLPTYPFDNKTYWAGKGKEELNEIPNYSNFLTMKRRESIEDKEYIYTKRIYKNSFYIKDHVAKGNGVLPGVVYLEMGKVIGDIIYPEGVNVFTDIHFLSPLTFTGNDEFYDIEISAERKRDLFEFKIANLNDTNLIYQQGYFMQNKVIKNNTRYNLESIIKECNRSISSEVCYSKIKDRGLSLGKSFRAIQKVYVNDHKNEALAQIALPSNLQNDFYDYKLHPSIFDGALEVVSSITNDNMELTLPHSIERIEIYHQLEKECYSYVKYSKYTKDDIYTKFDVDIVSTNGDLIMAIRGFTFLKVELFEKSSLHYFVPVWNNVQIDGSVHNKGTILYIGKDDDLWKELHRRYSNSIVIHDSIYSNTRENSAAYVIDSSVKKTCINILQNLKDDDIRVFSIVLGWGIDTNITDYKKIFGSLLNITQAGLEVFGEIQFTFCYNNRFDNLLYESVIGYSKSINMEIGKPMFKVIEFEDTTNDIGNKLVEEIFDNTNLEIKYQNDLRTVQQLKELEKSGIVDNAPENNYVYIITGGNGHIGRMIAKELSKSYNSTIILIGRANINANIEEFVKSLLIHNNKAFYYSLDLCNIHLVKDRINDIKTRFGDIKGVIHCAGIIQDSSILSKNKESAYEVLAAKIECTNNLDLVLKDEKLSFFVLASSLSSVIGNAGQCDYAYANSFLNNFARYRNTMVKQGIRFGKTTSIVWPLWENGGIKVSQEMKEFFAKSIGIEALCDEDGIHSFNYANVCNQDELIVIKGQVDNLNKKLGIKLIQNNSSVPNAKNISYKDNINYMNLQEELGQIISEMLKIPLVDLDNNCNIMEYGFNSISLIELTNKINAKFKLPLMPSIYYEYNNIKELADYITKEYSINIDEEKREDINQKSTFVENNNEHQSELRKRKQDYKEDVAIVGMSGKFPQAENLNEFWENIVNEKDCISHIPSDRWDINSFNTALKQNQQMPIPNWGGFMNDVDKFDADFFEISPREAILMDPQQRILFQNVWNTLEDSGHRISDFSDTNTGIFIGVATSDYTDVLRAYNQPIDTFTSTGASHCILCNRISYFFNWHGPSEPIDTACSSSLVAIHRAVTSILEGDCDQAIAGGINVILSPLLYMSFGMAKMLAPDGRCKSFDRDADGYVRGEGVGTILLKPLSKARQDGDHIYGIIKGTAINHGGRANSLTAPNPKLQAEVIKTAFKRAGFDLNTVGYIEAHGTGTNLGDPVEIEGLKMVSKEYCNTSKYTEPCYVGTVKTNIGHLEAAAGIAGVLKVILAMKNNKIPGNVHLNTLNPFINMENSPFQIVKHTVEWKHLKEDNGSYMPYRAGVSSFGFGGTNVHIAIEQYHVQEEIKIESNSEEDILIVLSAKTKDALLKRINYLCAFIEAEENEMILLKDIAYTLHVGREDFEERIGVIVRNKKQLLNELRLYLKGESVNVKYNKCISRNRQWLETRLGINIGMDIDNKKLLDLYLSGESINWVQYYKGKKFRRVRLPGYPFTNKCFWPSKQTPDFSTLFLKQHNYEENPNILKEENEIIEYHVDNNKFNSLDSIQIKIRNYLMNLIQEVCKISEENINGDTPFEHLGIESFMINELNERLSNDFDNLERTLFFEFHTLNELVEYFMREKKEEISMLFGTPPDKIEINQSAFIEKDNSFLSTDECEDIAIIGINGKYPMSDNLSEYWENLKNGRDCIEEIPIDRWDYKKYYSDDKTAKNKINSKWGGFISDVDKFDPLFFRITPSDAEHIDPQERLFLENVYGTLEDGGYCSKSNPTTRVGVFVGVIHGHYQLFAVEETLNGNLTSLYSSYASIANRVSYFFNFKGPSMAVDTMCSSSLTAIHLACESIKRGECEMAIAGGVNLNIHPDKYIFLSQQKFTSSDGKCRAFGEGGDGYVPGEGVGSVLLKPLKKAILENDNIYAVIKGSAINHGGRTNGYSVSNPSAQAEVIEEAINKSKIDPRTINYIEAHGTGTELGDPIEIRGLNIAFEKYTRDKHFCRIGSVKSNIGHCEAAAGIASLTKVILQMKHRKLVPSLHSRILNENINFKDSPFQVQHDLEEWKPVSLDNGEDVIKYPLRAGISSFGAGGSNVHLIMEEYNKAVTNEVREKQNELIVFSAKNENALLTIIDSHLKLFSRDLINALDEVEDKCIKLIGQIQEISYDEIYLDIPFEEYGFNKATYYKLSNEINTKFNTEFSVEDILSNNTISLLTRKIKENYNEKLNIKDISYTLAMGRWHHNEIRVAFIAKDIKELVQNMESFLEGHIVDKKIYINGKSQDDYCSEEDIKSSIKKRDLEELAKLWVKGLDIDFGVLFSQNSRRKISLPLYPFERKVIWFTPSNKKKQMKPSKLEILEKLENGNISLDEAESLMEDIDD